MTRCSFLQLVTPVKAIHIHCPYPCPFLWSYYVLLSSINCQLLPPWTVSVCTNYYALYLVLIILGLSAKPYYNVYIPRAPIKSHSSSFGSLNCPSVGGGRQPKRPPRRRRLSSWRAIKRETKKEEEEKKNNKDGVHMRNGWHANAMGCDHMTLSWQHKDPHFSNFHHFPKCRDPFKDSQDSPLYDSASIRGGGMNSKFVVESPTCPGHFSPYSSIVEERTKDWLSSVW